MPDPHERFEVTVRIVRDEPKERPLTDAERESDREQDEDARYRGTEVTREERARERAHARYINDKEESEDAGWRD